MIGLIESYTVVSVDCEVGGVNIVALHNPFEDLRLMHSALLHEVDCLILHYDCVIDVVIELHLQFVLELPGLVEELLVLNWLRKVLVVLSEEVELADVRPGIEAVAHGVLCPNSHILSTSQEEELVDLLLKVLPVENVGHPGESVRSVEEHRSELPRPSEGIDEESVVCQGDESVIHYVRVLQVDCAVLNVVARVDEQLTITVKLEGLRGLINLISALEVLCGTLGQLSLRSPHDFVQVLDLTETALRLLNQRGISLSTGSSQEGRLSGENWALHEHSRGVFIHHFLYIL